MRSLVDALGSTAEKLLKGVDDLGPNKAVKMTPKDAAAYREYGKAYHEKHGSLTGHMKVNYLGDEFSLKKNKDSPDGSVNLKTRNKKVKDKGDATRKYNENKGFDAIQAEQDRLGRPQEETDKIIKDAKEGNRRQATKIHFQNKNIKDPKKKRTIGHIRAVGRPGSLNVPENRINQNARYNYATQDKADAPDLNIRMAGAPDNKTTYIKQLQLANEFGPEFKLANLPDRIRRKILAAKDSDEIDDIIQAYEASKKRRKRK
jgi:hypothetical protein